jgi:hypothetical protein
MSQAGDKLAATRRAIIEQAQHRDRRREHADRPSGGIGQTAGDAAEDGDEGGWLGGLGHALKTWWRHHPAHMALELATPVLSGYARRKPLQFLGIAAAAGAVIVVARPWKLISATGLLMAVLKSSQVTGLVLSAMSAARYGQEPERPE